MYQAHTFDLPELEGISTATIDEHLKLYAGYVKQVNYIQETLPNITDEYAKREMQRRLGFEFGGMKNHEYYFTQFEGGASDLPPGKLKDMVVAEYGTPKKFVEALEEIAGTRGVGWAMCYLDQSTDKLVLTWVDEQQIGQLADVKIVLALDMWEHSYMLDYSPSQKSKYIEAFFKNLNWEVVAGRVA